MLGRRQKQKYEIVDTVADDFDLDYDTTKKKIITPACLWTCLTTGILISIYFAPSIGLTFYQKWLLHKFKFPLSIVMVHMIVKYILAVIVRNILSLKFGKHRMNLGWKDYIICMAPTGIFSSIDIGFSNWGLELINVSLYTMTKSTDIVFILVFAILLKLEKKSWILSIVVMMISSGLCLFTYKATEFNATGFTLILIASMSCGLRWTCVQLLMQKSKLGMKNPIDMMYHMQPFMIISLIPFTLLIEGFSMFQEAQSIYSKDPSELNLLIFQVLVGAFIAFFMEVTEIMVVSYTSSLTLSIAGVFKQIIIIILAVEWNGDNMSAINIVGLVLCLCGIACHITHKIRTTPMTMPGRTIEFDASDRFDIGMGKSLIEDTEQISISSENEDEQDSQVLFNILSRHEK